MNEIEIKLDQMSPEKRAEIREFFYQQWRDSNFVRPRRQGGFSRCGGCGCAWSPKLHGDFCPEHGTFATMMADLEQPNPDRMFLDWSPLAKEVIYTDLEVIAFANPNSRDIITKVVLAKMVTVVADDFGGEIPPHLRGVFTRVTRYDGQGPYYTIEAHYAYEPVNNFVCVYRRPVDPRVTKAASGILI